MKRGHSRLTKRKSNVVQLPGSEPMYVVKSSGQQIAQNQQMTHVIAEAEQKTLGELDKEIKDAELWQDGKYIAQLTWMGSYFRVDYTGD